MQFMMEKNAARLAHRSELETLIEQRFRSRTRAHVIVSLEAADIPTGAVNDVPAVVGHLQLAARGRWTTVAAPGGEIPALIPPHNLRGVTPRMGLRIGGWFMQGDWARPSEVTTKPDLSRRASSGGVEVEYNGVKSFIRRSDLARDRQDQRPERFQVGDKVDARVTNIDTKTRRLGLSIKAREIAEEKEAIDQYGSSDSGASLGDILGAALNRDR